MAASRARRCPQPAASPALAQSLRREAIRAQVFMVMKPDMA